MSEPSPELVEEIARVIFDKWNYEDSCSDNAVRAAKLVLASPSIARALETRGLSLREAIYKEAMQRIKTMKSTPIGDTGFNVGPQALFDACQRLARAALQEKSTPQATGLSAIAQERDEEGRIEQLEVMLEAVLLWLESGRVTASEYVTMRAIRQTLGKKEPTSTRSVGAELDREAPSKS